jgi:phospholipid/cholesterol/gamma-HCH transport system permease protein
MFLTPVLRLGELGLYVAAMARAIPRPPRVSDRVWVELARTLRVSVLPVILVTGPFGMVVALQGLQILEVFGTQRLLSSVIALAVLRELAPALSSMMLAAQAGSAAAAEVASLKVTEQWDALEAMATPARKYVTFPRLCALALAAPILSLLGSLAGIAGGYLVEVTLKGFPSGIFFAELTGFLSVSDVLGGVLKASIFGVMAGVLAGFHGERARGGARGVGMATNHAVVSSVAVILVANYLLSSLLFGAP